eukprot:344549-Chlamydomonas_euryale.AAC.3
MCGWEGLRNWWTDGIGGWADWVGGLLSRCMDVWKRKEEGRLVVEGREGGRRLVVARRRGCANSPLSVCFREPPSVSAAPPAVACIAFL